MKKYLKAIVAIMLMTVAVFAGGCNPDEESNDNGGGASGNGTYNGHDYVDLGLTSGTLWATCNVGADSPEDYGDYFAWGETQPKTNYSLSNYKYCNGDDESFTKYCSDFYCGTMVLPTH